MGPIGKRESIWRFSICNQEIWWSLIGPMACVPASHLFSPNWQTSSFASAHPSFRWKMSKELDRGRGLAQGTASARRAHRESSCLDHIPAQADQAAFDRFSSERATTGKG